jgi:CDP-diacylglycerol--glycerol-3-phosphate 3-phosphatidyltransferase
MLKRLPNDITFVRLALVPVFVILLYQDSVVARWLAFAVFVFAAVTDYVDGYLARRFGAVSDLGKLLDPLVDKVLILAALVMLLARRDFGEAGFTVSDGSPWVPAWLVIVILGRELWVTGLRGMAAAQGVIVAAGRSGKVKSGLQMVAVSFLLAGQVRFSVFELSISARFIGLNLLMLSALVGVWGAYQYTVTVLGEKKSQRSPNPGTLKEPN